MSHLPGAKNRSVFVSNSEVISSRKGLLKQKKITNIKEKTSQTDKHNEFDHHIFSFRSKGSPQKKVSRRERKLQKEMKLVEEEKKRLQKEKQNIKREIYGVEREIDKERLLEMTVRLKRQMIVEMANRLSSKESNSVLIDTLKFYVDLSEKILKISVLPSCRKGGRKEEIVIVEPPTSPSAQVSSSQSDVSTPIPEGEKCTIQ